MKLIVVTPKKLIVDTEVKQVTLPGSDGEMTILPNHTYLLSNLKRGTLRYPEGELKVSEGFVEVHENKVTVCVNSIS